MDLSDRTAARPFTVHTQSSMDVSKPTKEVKTGTTPLKKTESTSRGEAEDVTPSKAAPATPKSTKTTTTDKNKHRDVATTPGTSTSETNHATSLSSILPTLSENSYSDGDMTPPLSIVEDYVEQQKSSPAATESEPQAPARSPQQADTVAKTKPHSKKKQRDYDVKIQSLSKEVIVL
ncbi:hypothetical protein TELCIR_13907 [Teladorsagia circumcincta]|uniref:Uncharacterized protein n=1 Tax=Teladorsagia circumcincta TaxID=45464 RepID=A0A2G9U2Q7_TELCI|nr:hypothetical protein TELCIR_13907 [Teladorsagia circumcincta]